MKIMADLQIQGTGASFKESDGLMRAPPSCPWA
jgi:hypothetical protein